MGFKFSYLCDLLSSLECNRILKASTAAKNDDLDKRTINNWFNHHEKRIHDTNTDPLAFLSCLLPERRTDRVYWLQDASLSRVIGRCLLLGISRKAELDNWRAIGGHDLGQCVENVMRQAENPIVPGQEVTTEEIDVALNKIASRCRFSGPQVRRQHAAVDVDNALRPLYLRLGSRDAKWLTRMILKSYSPVVLPLNHVLRNFHFLLPDLLLFQDSFDAAINLLSSTPLGRFPPRPETRAAKGFASKAIEYLTPRIGIKVGRREFYKARSIKHCCKMAGQRRMSLERKYDGEYCQMHIDLSKSRDCIQIFSKSGKDSTADKMGVHDALRQSLRIGLPDCKFSRHCILEGELLVWSDKKENILEFHNLRKFITRSGTFIGTDNDSQPKPYEHLMMMFFDILLLDDIVCLTKAHRERRLMLQDTITLIPGRAGIAEQQILDFSSPGSQRKLEVAFSRGIAERWEGYVLKGCDEPYFSMLSPSMNNYSGAWIKLKKDYIPGLGDTADFALIGGTFDSRDAMSLKQVKKLLWTHFHVGCLENKDAVIEHSARPKFRVVDVINRQNMSLRHIQLLNEIGQFSACDNDCQSPFDIWTDQSALPKINALFKTPFVVEMLGSGFDRPSNSQYFTLRFPRILKIHWDRTFEETTSILELQNMAEAASSVPVEELSRERKLWTERIKAANGKSEYIMDESQSNSAPSTPPSSPAVQLMVGTVNVERQRRRSHSLTDACLLSSPSQQHSQSPSHLSGKHPLSSPEGKFFNLPSHKRPRSSGLCMRGVPIFEDKMPTSVSPLPDLHGSDRLLKDISNMSQKNTNTEDNGNPVIHAFIQEENIIPSQSVERPQGGKNSDPEGGRLSLPNSPVDMPDTFEIPATGGIELNNASCTLAESSKPHRINLQSPFVTMPVFLGRFFFESCDHRLEIERLFRAQAREFTFANRHFVEKLFSAPMYKNPLFNSNPSATLQDIRLGFTLVDGRSAAESSVARDILEVGNEVAKFLNSNAPQLPSNGKIFFLDWRILQLGTGVEDRMFCLKETWTSVAKSYFRCCIVWDYKGTKGKTSKRSDSGGQVKRRSDVITIWEGSTLEVLGEFSSLDPPVHVSGESFE
ncbi:hypothetical protein V8E54_003931 [Elaphomyces granulatus]